VNFRTLDALFALRAERAPDCARCDISISLLEIYNEAIRDLMAPHAKGAEPAELKIRDVGTVSVPGLTLRAVHSREDVTAAMQAAYRNRTTFATNMNEHSSRSHCVLSVHVESVSRVTGAASRGRLHLVDLAGSERVGRSGATGDRLKEAQAINKSLSALGDVIAARAEKKAHVPFRNSTLTHLLSESLSGDSKTLMFVNASPIMCDSEETFCSLNFAQRVRTVELGVARRHVEAGAAAAGGH
jgi:kinesin family protein C2/C3